MKHLSIDLETLSLNENAHILSIGAAFFCPEKRIIGHSFYIETLRGVEQKGAHLSVSTMDWWLRQDDGVMTVMPESEHLEIGEALKFFKAWVERHSSKDCPLMVYQQGSKDSEWLFNAGARFDVKMPWSYRSVFCARTLWAHHEPSGHFTELDGTAHNALDDARWVANRMIEVLA